MWHVGFIVAAEAAGVFFLDSQAVCPAGRAAGPASCSFSSRVTFSQTENSEAVSSPRSTKQVVDKIVGSRK